MRATMTGTPDRSLSFLAPGPLSLLALIVGYLMVKFWWWPEVACQGDAFLISQNPWGFVLFALGSIGSAVVLGFTLRPLVVRRRAPKD